MAAPRPGRYSPGVRATALVAVSFAASGAACGPAARGPESPGGAHVPSHVLERVEGGHWDLAEIEGHPTVVLLFTTYSLYSQHLAGLLTQVWEKRSSEGLEVVAISTDPEAPEVLRAWRDFLEIPYPVIRGDDAVHQGAWPLGPIPVVPLLVFVDRGGAVVARVATVPDEDTLDAAVGELLED